MSGLNYLKLLALISFLLWAIACSHKQKASVQDKLDQCEVPPNAVSPLVVNWPATKKALLQTQSENKVVIVHYDGCRLELLDGCNVRGKYDYKKTVRSKDRMILENSKDLMDKLVIGADELEKEMRAGAKLRLSYVTAGTKKATINPDNRGMMIGSCDEATHFVDSMVLGAYEISQDISGQGKGGEKREVIRSGGDLNSCSKMDTAAGAEACKAIVEMYLVPITDMTSGSDGVYANMTEEIDRTIEQESNEMGGFAEMMEAIRRAQVEGEQKSDEPTLDATNLTGLSARIAGVPNGGSDEWDRTIAPMMIETYDKNDSKSIDEKKEVESIPCDVVQTLDKAIRKGRGKASALRTTYGFPPDFAWVGSALGFDAKVRADADAHLEKCGL